MNTKTIMRLVVAPAVALAIGCIGVEMIDQTRLGWILLATGIAIPIIIILHSRLEK
jgi:hypothetical protein